MSDLTNLKPPFVSVTPFGWNTAKTRMIGGMRIGYLLKRRSLTLMLSKESLTSNTLNQALWVTATKSKRNAARLSLQNNLVNKENFMPHIRALIKDDNPFSKEKAVEDFLLDKHKRKQSILLLMQ
jgi:hypothetical protein